MTEENTAEIPSQAPRPEGVNQRVEARIAAIKALYSNEVNDDKKSAAELALEMLSVYETNHQEGEVQPNRKFLKELLSGAIEHQQVIDEKIKKHLQSGWKLERLGAVMISLLRCAVFELMAHEHRAIKVIINEYVDIAHGFFEEKEVKFVNGVLDKIAKEVRSYGLE